MIPVTLGTLPSCGFALQCRDTVGAVADGVARVEYAALLLEELENVAFGGVAGETVEGRNRKRAVESPVDEGEDCARCSVKMRVDLKREFRRESVQGSHGIEMRLSCV